MGTPDEDADPASGIAGGGGLIAPVHHQFSTDIDTEMKRGCSTDIAIKRLREPPSGNPQDSVQQTAVRICMGLARASYMPRCRSRLCPPSSLLLPLPPLFRFLSIAGWCI